MGTCVEESNGVVVEDVDVVDVVDDDDGGGVTGCWELGKVVVVAAVVDGFSSDVADSFSFLLFFFSDGVDEGVVETVRLLLARLLPLLLLLLLLLLLIGPRRNCISALGSIVQKAPLPGSSSLRGTLTNALLRERLCRIEFYTNNEYHRV